MIRFIYDIEYKRTIFGVLVDARKGTPIANQIGIVIKNYVDGKIALVGPNSIPYKLETHSGTVAGYMTLEVSGTIISAVLGQFVLRPAFQQFSTEILSEIGTFIQSNVWKSD